MARKRRTKKELLVGIQDVHGGSNVAICPPEGMELDEGQQVMPSRLQRIMWRWFLEMIDEIQELQEVHRPWRTVLAVNGDMTDGDHHRTAQIVSPLESIHVRVAYKVLTTLMDSIEPDEVHMTRGTPAHAGRSGGLEEGLARVLLNEAGYPLVRDPDTHQVTSYWRRYYLGATELLVDQRHHGRMGTREHTRIPYGAWYAQDIEREHQNRGERPPDLALRAHNHFFQDTARPHGRVTRVVTGPSWQAQTEWSHKRAFESLPSVGLYAIVVYEDGRDDVIPLLRSPLSPSIAGGKK